MMWLIIMISICCIIPVIALTVGMMVSKEERKPNKERKNKWIH